MFFTDKNSNLISNKMPASTISHDPPLIDSSLSGNLNFDSTSFPQNWSSSTLCSEEPLNNFGEEINEIKSIPTVFMDVSEFQNKLNNNKGLVILKFGASWCVPCKKVEPYFINFYKFIKQKNNPVSEKIECINIDVDDSFELYATMKRLRMVKGLPTFLAFYKGNRTYISEDSSIGSDISSLQGFFTRCLENVK